MEKKLCQLCNRYRLSVLISIIVFFAAYQLNAQIPQFVQFDYLQAFSEGKLLQYPWAGSINSGQIAQADVNNDDILDIIVFEKTENRLLVFLGKGNGDYTFTRAYSQDFPPVNGWMICKDFNCDDIEDFFTYNNGSIVVYKGYYQQDTLKFTKLYDELSYRGFSANPVNLYSSFVDKPAVYDIDQDGDLDILTFNVTANRLLFYSNQRIENSWNCDSLGFKLVDYCWGNIFESGLSPLLDLRDTCQDKSPSLRADGNELAHKILQHTGSTLDVWDIDNNGLADVLMGDVSLSLLNYLPNTGILQEASILSQDTSYPSYNTPARVISFPVPVFADINNDNRMDLVVSPFEGFGTDNIENIWWYENSSDDSVRLNLVTKSFLTEEMIDVGEAAVPCLIDINGDGLKDLIVGSGAVRSNGAPVIYPLYFYKNIGSQEYPVFSLEDKNFLNFVSTGLMEPAPSAGDIDNDGDTDLLIGLADGRILLYKNTSGNNSFVSDNPIFITSGSNILDVGQNASISIADLNKDGKNDLIIGERNGNINFYSNTSTGANLSFSMITDSLGKLSTATPGIPFGYASPKVLDINADGKLDMIVGGFEYILFWIDNIEDSIFSKVTPVQLLENKATGRRMSPVLDDLTLDGQLEMLIGLQSGGLWIFSESPPAFQPVSVPENAYTNFSIKAFPNPLTSEFIIEVFGGKSSEYQYFIHDITGKLLVKDVFKESRQLIQLNLAAGIYILSVTDGIRNKAIKIMVH